MKFKKKRCLYCTTNKVVEKSLRTKNTIPAPPPTSDHNQIKMAVSTPPPPHPPPPDPTSTSTTATATTATTATTASTASTAATAATTRSNFPPNRRLPNRLSQTSPFFSTTPTSEYHHIPLLPSNPNPNYPRLVPSHDSTAPTTASSTSAAAILYPVASSGRGFIAPQMSLTNPNSNSNNIYTARPAVLSSSYHRPPFGHSHRDPALGQAAIYGNGVGNPTPLQQPGVLGNSAVKGAPVSAPFSQPQHKVALSSTPVCSFNGHKDLRERNKDDVFVTVHDRKVRASDNTSLYALCRSWLKNGSPEESQLQNLDAVRSLPRPLPLSAQDSTSPTIVEEFKEVEEDEGSVENLSQKELLQRHVERAKRIRSRLREQRLRRIAPYKNRLSLLLHPVVDSNFRNDSVSGE